MLLTVWFFPPAARAEAPPSQQQRQPAPARSGVAGAVLGTATEAERLLEREQQSQNLKDFEGGGHVSMTTTTLIIILLLIIVIILII